MYDEHIDIATGYKIMLSNLSPTECRVIVNGLNREWHHLEKLRTELGVQIANENNTDKRATMIQRHANYTEQQSACDLLITRIQG
jgi:hypothetical protein